MKQINIMKQRMVLLLLAVILLINIGQTQPTLGTTDSFALFSGTGAFNGDGASTVIGNVGTNTAAYTSPGTVIGTPHVMDGVSAQAATDVLFAFGDFPGSGTVIGVLGLGTLNPGGEDTLIPGNYLIGAAVTINGVLTLNGQGVYIIDIDGALSTAMNSAVVLINGASICDVYWKINGELNLGAASSFSGTAITSGAINMGAGASLSGRGLSTAGAIGMNANIVSIGLQPTASVIVADGPTTFCAGDSVTLSGNVGGTWSNSSVTASITVYASGDYYVTNTNSCGSDTSNHIIVVVISAQTCTITGVSSVCPGQTTQLCVPAGASSYSWSNGSPSDCVVVGAGTYSVTVTSNGCSSTCSTTVTTGSSSPIAAVISANGPTIFCAGDKVILSGNNGGVWSTGSTSASITVTVSGDYFVTTSNSCGSVTSNHIQVTVAPPSRVSVIKATVTAFCIGGSATLSGNNGGVWNTGSTSPSIIVTTAGDYFVVNSDQCGDLVSNHIQIVVDNPPVASVIFASDTMICVGGSVQIAGNIGGVWNTGETTPYIIVTKSGDYFVTTRNACGTMVSNHIKVKVMGIYPSCVIKGNNLICEGQSSTLCAPAGYTYLWSTGETSRCITVNKLGRYTVAVNNNGCISICGRTILPAEPVCVITGKSEIYKGQPTEWCAPAGYTYKWSTGETTQCIKVSTAGNYSVTVTKNGCSSSCSKTLKVGDVVCIITGDSIICPGSIDTLCAAHVEGNTYFWNNGQTTRCIEINCQGKYIVTVTNNKLSTICTLVVKNERTFLESRSTGFEVRSYPNPFQRESIIEFKGEDGHVRIELFSITGKKLYTLFDKDIRQGLLYVARVNGDKLAEGTYLYRITNGGRVMVKTLLLVKE